MSWHDRGVRLRRKPTRALHTHQHCFTPTTASMCYRSLHRCRIPKRLPQIALDAILRREVELLKELRRDGDAPSCPNTVESRPVGFLSTHCEVVIVHISMAVAICEVLFERCVTVLNSVLKRAVVVHCRHVGCGLAGPQRLEEAAISTEGKRIGEYVLGEC